MLTDSSFQRRRLAIALISAAILSFEIVVLRIFSFTIWHHFAYMVISVALLGFAVSGVWLTRRASHHDLDAGRAASLFALTSILATVVIGSLSFDPTRLVDDPAQLGVLLLYYIVLAVPFTFGGLVVGGLLSADPGGAPRLYAADLVGAGLGALSVVWLLPRVSAEGSVLISAALALAAAALLFSTQRRWQSIAIVAALLLLLASPLARDGIAIKPGPGKQLARLLGTPGPSGPIRTVHTEWNALARVDLLNEGLEAEWTINPQRRTPQLWQPVLILDGDAATPLVNPNAPPEQLKYLDHTLPSAALQAFRPERVLVIGAGGGVDVLTALHHGARAVDAVEINPAVIDITTRLYKEQNGRLFERPGVRLIQAEGRAFVAQSRDSYGLIQISLIDTWAASASGAYSLAEGYLYTVEAFEDYFARLNDTGVLSITRWGGTPPREVLKLCSVAWQALHDRGVSDPSQHIVVLGLGSLGSVLVKPNGFSREELAALARVASEHGFSPVYAPDLPQGTVFDHLLRAKSPTSVIREQSIDIAPATDDRPYFFQFGRWSDLLSLDSWRENQLFLSGRLILLTVLIQAAGFALLLLWLAQRVRAPGEVSASSTIRWSVIGYFLLIGVAFMLIELTLMQRLTLFLGSPLLATSVVLATVLIGAGAGSALSSRWPGPERSPRALFIALAVMAGALGALLPKLLHLAISLPFSLRLIVATLIVFAAGVLLGMPLPLAMARLSHLPGTGWVGRAWAANGAGSVIGPILAAIWSIDFGLSATTWLGGALYLLAYRSFQRLWVRGETQILDDPQPSP
jgi:hypothetical protein